MLLAIHANFRHKITLRGVIEIKCCVSYCAPEAKLKVPEPQSSQKVVPESGRETVSVRFG